MSKSISNISSAFNQSPWMILDTKFEEIKNIVIRHHFNSKLSVEEIKAAIELSSFQSSNDRRMGSEPASPLVGVVSVLDTLVNRATIFDAVSGATSYQKLAQNISALSATVDDLVMDIDSPGGAVNGISAVVDAIKKFKSLDRINSNASTGNKKRVYAVVNDMAASAAYFIAAHADEIIVSETSTTGSIGVMMVHMDLSARDEKKGIKQTVLTSGPDKSTGHSSAPLSKEDKAKLQSMLSNLHMIFVSSVAEGRDMDIEKVKELATGRVFHGLEAIGVGLADSQGSLQSTINNIIQQQLNMPNTNKTLTASDDNAVVAVADDKISKLEAMVASLAGSIGKITSSLEANQLQMEEKAKATLKSNATSLVNAAVKSNKIAPAQAASLIEQASASDESYELVQKIIGSIQGSNIAIPVGNPFGSPVQSTNAEGHSAQMDPAAKAIFSQLGLLDQSGNLSIDRVTLPINGDGKSDHFGAQGIVNFDANHKPIMSQDSIYTFQSKFNDLIQA